MKLVGAFGINGLYVLMFGALARFVLHSPRMVGVFEHAEYYFVVALGTIIGFLGAAVLSFSLVDSVMKSKSKKNVLTIQEKRRIRKTLMSVALVSLIAVAIVVWANWWFREQSFPFFYFILFLVSLFCAASLESLRQTLRPELKESQ